MNGAKVCFAIPNLFFRSFTHYLVLRSIFSIINLYQASIPFEIFFFTVTTVQVRIIPDFRLSSDAFFSYSVVQTSRGVNMEVSLLSPSLTMIKLANYATFKACQPAHLSPLCTDAADGRGQA